MPLGRFLTRVSVVPDVHLSDLLSELSPSSAPFPSCTLSVSNVTSLPFASLPVRVSSAPATSLPRTFALLIATSVRISSTIVTLPSSTRLSPWTSVPVILPFSTVKMMSVVTAYPSGAATSWSVYVPLGRFLTVVEVFPDVQLSFVESELSPRTASSPSCTSPVLNVMLLPFASLPVRVSSAPATSLPRTSALLISTSVVMSSITMIFPPSTDEPPST